jgi:cell division septation protein DedD
MRNINKIKEIKDDKYHFTLDNKQIAAMIISVLFLGAALFLTGYSIGKEGINKNNITDEMKTKNIAIINTNTAKQNKGSRSNTTTVKDVALLHPQSKDDGIASSLSKDDGTASSLKKEGGRSNATTVTDVAMLHPLKDNGKTTVTQLNPLENKDKNNTLTKLSDSSKDTDSLPLKKENKGTGDKPFKTTLKSDKEGKYILQVLATPKEKEANELKERLIESGYKAFIEKIDSNGVIYNRVRVGFFQSFENAKLFKDNFEKESGINKTFITIKK